MICDKCGAEVVAEFVTCDDGTHYDQEGNRVGKIVNASAHADVVTNAGQG